MLHGVEGAQAPPAEVEHLPAAPVLPEDDAGQNTLTHLLPLTGVLGSVTMVVGIGPAGAGGRGLWMAGALIASTGAMAAAQVLRQRMQRRRALERARHEHLHRLSAAAARLTRWAADQREVARRRWPHPTDLVPAAPPTEVQRSARDEQDELMVRIGCSDLSDAVRIVVEPSGPGIADPVCREALLRFAEAHSTLRGLPSAVPLGRLRRLEFVSPTAAGALVHEAAVRALVLSAARAHASDRLNIAVLCTAEESVRWDWCKWLPHCDPTSAAAPLVDHRAAHLVARAPHGRHLLLVVSPAWSALHPPVPPEELPPDHTVVTSGDPRTLHAEHSTDDTTEHLRLTLTAPDTASLSTGQTLRVDLASLTEAAATARSLSRRDRGTAPQAGPDPVALTLASHPTPRTGRDLLRTVIGTDAHGAPVHLDLKEAAHGGHGPHGLLVGATGSGKSELLRTVITSLVASHVPDDLALVLVDFKGGATFADVADLPQVAACVTNLTDDVSLVDRMQDALSGELERRQELLRAHGHPSIVSYREARRTGGADASPLPELPHLVVCVDEFSELLAARPEFVDLFTAIGRLGRSLGVHLLLASQRLDDGRLHALEAHLSYRIALRTFSAQESRAAIGVPDAHTLPRRPGAGLIRTGAEELSPFDALHLGRPVPVVSPEVGADPHPALFTVLGRRRTAGRPRPVARPGATPPSLERVLGERTRAALAEVTPTRQIWLPPLDAPITWGALLDDRAGAPAASPTGLRFPIGLLDLPREQRHAVWEVDLEGSHGHVAVVGAPRSGRSTTVQTLLSAWALRHPPTALHLHLVDLGGGALAALAALPHTVSHTTRDTTSDPGRLLQHLEALVREREQPDPASEQEHPRTVVVVDGWGALRADHPEAEDRLVALAPRALAVGVHLVLTALRWNELRSPLLDAVGTRIELRLGDPFDSVIDRRSAAAVPARLPGRGIAAGGTTGRIALPLLAAPPTGSTTPDATVAVTVAATVRTIAATWPGPAPARWRDLPDTVSEHELTPPTPGLLRLGLDEEGATCTHPADAHLVVIGPTGSGRSSLLQHEIDEWLRTRAGQVLVIDPRARWAGRLPADHLLTHLSDLSRTGDVLRALADRLTTRLVTPSAPHPSHPFDTPDAERHADGPPPVTVLVDDLDLCRDLGADLAPLLPLLPRAGALGLRMVAATRDQGHGLPDRWSALLDDLGATRIVLSGLPPGRGQLHRPGTPERAVHLCRPRVAAATG